MPYYYIITKTQDEDGRAWYGAAAFCRGKIQMHFADISTDIKSVLKLICMLNRENVSILHFADIIYDYMVYIQE